MGQCCLQARTFFPRRPHLLLAQAVHGVGGVLADLGPREVRVAVDGRLRLVVEVDKVLELQGTRECAGGRECQCARRTMSEDLYIGLRNRT